MEGAELVAEVKRQNPDATIEEVLDKVRFMTLQRIFNEIKGIKFDTTVHVIEELCDYSLTLEDTLVVLEWFGEFCTELRDETRHLIDSRSVAIIYKFCQTELNTPQPTCCMKLRCTSSTRRKTRQPS